MPRAAQLRLSKHHAAGNDFLVLMDLEGRRPLQGAEVAALCDRNRGIGADGILRVLDGGAEADLTMELRNADGTSAEMSGNGIRCLVQAAVDAAVVKPGALTVSTACGARKVHYEGGGPGLGHAEVEMGSAALGEEVPVEQITAGEIAWATRARRVSTGNPHLVVLCSGVDDATVEKVGGRLSRAVAGGCNVEFVATGSLPDLLVLRVFERGVGPTLACGTGACAAAVAMHGWGLVGPDVEVDLPGGRLEVQIRGGEVVLRGPTRRVAQIVVLESDLVELVREHSAHVVHGRVYSHGTMAGRL